MASKKRERGGNRMQDLQVLVDRARRGDETALPELKRALDENSVVWHTVGDLIVTRTAVCASIAPEMPRFRPSLPTRRVRSSSVPAVDSDSGAARCGDEDGGHRTGRTELPFPQMGTGRRHARSAAELAH